MKRKRIARVVYLSPTTTEALVRRAEREDISINAVVRQALNAFLFAPKEKKAAGAGSETP